MPLNRACDVIEEPVKTARCTARGELRARQCRVEAARAARATAFRHVRLHSAGARENLGADPYVLHGDRRRSAARTLRWPRYTLLYRGHQHGHDQQKVDHKSPDMVSGRSGHGPVIPVYFVLRQNAAFTIASAVPERFSIIQMVLFEWNEKCAGALVYPFNLYLIRQPTVSLEIGGWKLSPMSHGK